MLEFTIAQLKELLGGFSNDFDPPHAIGCNVFVRTVTHYYIGRVVSHSRDHLKLNDVSWVPDTGRFSDMLKTGDLSELEPYPDDVLVSISVGAIVDQCVWCHDLPRVQK